METWDVRSLEIEVHQPQVLRSDEETRAIAILLPAGEELQEHQVHERAYLFVADGHNDRVRILRRDTLAEVGQICDGGRQPGRFLAPGSVAVDSRGRNFRASPHAGPCRS